jgi:hypothetical protein
MSGWGELSLSAEQLICRMEVPVRVLTVGLSPQDWDVPRAGVMRRPSLPLPARLADRGK